jgi:hypothetical protein
MNKEIEENKRMRELKCKEVAQIIKDNENYRVQKEKEKQRQRRDDRMMLERQMKAMELQDQRRVDEMKVKEA